MDAHSDEENSTQLTSSVDENEIVITPAVDEEIIPLIQSPLLMQRSKTAYYSLVCFMVMISILFFGGLIYALVIVIIDVVK